MVKVKKQMIHNYNDYLKSHNKDILIVEVVGCSSSNSSSNSFVVNVLAQQQQ
jgi:hypothetical protein